MKKNSNEIAVNSFSSINANTVIRGEITSGTDLRIDGTVEGNIQSDAKIVFGPSAQIKGNIKCKNADVACSIEGNIYCDELLTLKTSARVKGDIFTQKLVVENGAIFMGKCEMGKVSSKNFQEQSKKVVEKQAE